MAEIRRVTDGTAIRDFVEPLAGKFLFELADLDDAAWSARHPTPDEAETGRG